jgi:hypothetical protein
MINGSQKTGGSNSGIILERLDSVIKEKHKTETYKPGAGSFSDETFKKIVSGEVIVLAFPLYIYSVPSRTLETLMKLEDAVKRERANNIIMYTVINCGFYEGRQCDTAFRIIENWCARAGVVFGGGIGQGAGEMLGQIKNVPLDKGPFANLARALQNMADKMELKEKIGIAYLSPYFPRFLWKLMATRSWNQKARDDGLSKKEMLRSEFNDD